MEQVIIIGFFLLLLLLISRTIRLWLGFLKFRKSVQSEETIVIKLKKYYRYKYDKLILALVFIFAAIVTYKDSSNYYLIVFLTIIATESFTEFYCLSSNYILFSDQGVSMSYFQKYISWESLRHIIEDGDEIILKFTKNEITIPLWGREKDLIKIVEQIDMYRPDIRQRG